MHCVSSSEPDSADMNTQNSENDWSRGGPQAVNCPPKLEYTDISSVAQLGKKPNTPIHMAYAESSTLVSGMHFIPEQMKSSPDGVVSSRNYDKMVPKRKHSDTLVVMGMGLRHIYEEDDGKSFFF